MKPPSEVFVILTGVSGNLGDAVIRRRVLAWCRGSGTVHAYVGRTTSGWIEQLGLDADEVVYRAADRRRWLARLAFGRGRRALVFDPGEVPLGREHLKSEVLFAALTAWTRLRGGVVIRPPRATAHSWSLTARLHRLSSRWSTLTLWRNRASFEQMKCGVLVPDTGFHEDLVPGRPWQERRSIIVSLRGLRPLPPPQWFEGVSTFAAANDLRIIVASQVDEDEARSAEVAALFGLSAEYAAWGDRSDLEQERFVRSLYEDAAMVISDRLHVLILSAMAGAVPCELVESPRPKVVDHFATIGVTGISRDITAMPGQEIADFAEGVLQRQTEIAALVRNGHSAIDEQATAIGHLVGSDSRALSHA